VEANSTISRGSRATKSLHSPKHTTVYQHQLNAAALQETKSSILYTDKHGITMRPPQSTIMAADGLYMPSANNRTESGLV